MIEPDHDHVVAWPVSHTKPDTFRDRREVEFTIRAQLLKKAAKKPTKTAAAEKPSSPTASAKDAETKEAGTKTTKDEL